jgi:hypothetical protein
MQLGYLTDLEKYDRYDNEDVERWKNRNEEAYFFYKLAEIVEINDISLCHRKYSEYRSFYKN